MPRALILTLAVIALCAAAWWLTRSEDPVTVVEPGPIESRQNETAVESVPAKPSPGADADAPQALPEETREAVSATGVDLRGWVGDTDGSGIGDIEIEIESRGFDGEEITTQRTHSDDSGDFLLRDIAPGRQYKLEIRPQGNYAAFSLDSFTTETAADLQRILLPRIDLVDVEGMIVDTDFAPVPDFELTVRSLAVEYPDRTIRSDSTGYFRLPAFPAGELRIATNASDYYRIKGIELRPDEYRNLTLMIDRGNYHLSGWVGDDNGAPLEDVQITLKSAFAADGYHSFSYRTAVTDSNGGFEFAGLGGHRLTLGVYARGYESLIRQHVFESFSDRIEIRLQRQAQNQADPAAQE